MTEYGAFLECPECGTEVKCTWPDKEQPKEHQCPQGHVFTASWPGFVFQPVTIVTLWRCDQ